LLTCSTAIAAAVVLIGLVLLFASRHDETANFAVFHSEPSELTNPVHVVTGAMKASPDRPLHVLQAGILILIVTPILRVIFTLITFVVRRDVLYIVVSLIVLGALLYGLMGGEV
jgi:uncharacterized membrane protein